jgi:hypothetical protein
MHPAARHGLSFPAAPAPSTASWLGYSIQLDIIWRVSSNVTGLQAATAAIRHHLGGFASRQRLGCCVEGREHADRIQLFVDGINEHAVPGDAALGLPKKLHDALKNVARSANHQVSQCHFVVRVREQTKQLDSDVLKRINGDVPPRDGFRSWYKSVPAPSAPAPAPTASKRTPGEVALALGVELSNLRSEFHVAASTKELDSCCSRALQMLEILHKYMSGVAASPAPAAESGKSIFKASPPCVKSDLSECCLRVTCFRLGCCCWRSEPARARRPCANRRRGWLDLPPALRYSLQWQRL